MATLLPFLTFSSSQAAVKILKPPHIAIITAAKYRKFNKLPNQVCITVSAVPVFPTISVPVIVQGSIALTEFNPIKNNHAVA